jgi:hypothetical protein
MEKKLKVAVYINGQWRGSSFKCSEYIKPYFEQFDVDYYIHTCDYYYGKNIKLDFSKNELDLDIVELDEIYHSKQDIERIKNTYDNVVYFQVDTKEKNQEITSLKKDISAFYNIYGGYKCNQYRKIYENMNGFFYDVIIKIRPDIIFKKDTQSKLNKLVKFISNNPECFFSEHSIPNNPYIEPSIDYPIDIFQVGKNFFDVLDNWVSETLKGKSVFLSDYVLDLGYDIRPRSMPGFKVYIIRELYKYNNLLELFHNGTTNYKETEVENSMCDLDEIMYMENSGRNEKKEPFKNWDIDFESIISLCDKNINHNTYQLNNKGLKKLADEIERNWN